MTKTKTENAEFKKAKEKRKRPLSAVPHEAIRQAVEDLNWCLSCEDKYVVDMDVWHQPNWDFTDRCRVCLAGAVMAASLNVPDDLLTDPGYFTERRHRLMLHFLDYCRDGINDKMLSIVGWSMTAEPPLWITEPFPYSWSLEHHEAWCQHMLAVADWLEENTHEDVELEPII